MALWVVRIEIVDPEALEDPQMAFVESKSVVIYAQPGETQPHQNS